MKILMLEKCLINEQQRLGVSKVISILDLRGRDEWKAVATKKAPEGAFLLQMVSSKLELVANAEVVANAA